MIFVKDDNSNVYLKGTDVKLSSYALTEIAKQLGDIIDGNLEKIAPANQKKATILKSFNTEAGAKNWLEVQKKLNKSVEGAIIVKSMNDYYREDGMMLPPAPVHVVVEESMAPVAEVVSVKDSDEMFKQMYRKGLLSVDYGMISLSAKFHELLQKFTDEMLKDTLKSSEMTEEGKTFKELGEEILKAATNGGGTAVTPDGKGSDARPKEGSKGDVTSGLPLTEEEASNDPKSGDKGKSVPEDGTGSEKRADQADESVDGLGLTQEEADNKNAQPGAISDEEAKKLQTTVEASPQRELAVMKSEYFFKSLPEARAAERDLSKEFGVAFESRETTYSEKLRAGKNRTYIATPTQAREKQGSFGARKHRN